VLISVRETLRGRAGSAATSGAAADSKEAVEEINRTYASFTIATIIPITTNTTIAICIQIQVGDIAGGAYWRAPRGGYRRAPLRARLSCRG
jgi:hypothetical protein